MNISYSEQIFGVIFCWLVDIPTKEDTVGKCESIYLLRYKCVRNGS
jgi:hypothetical protein